MTATAFLEDFADPKPKKSNTEISLNPDTPGYDEGYSAGWSDALESERESADKVTRDMAIALQEAGFTYFEARQHVLKSLRPVLEAISNVLLPEIAQSSLGPKIAETIEKLAESIEDPVEIFCPVAAEETLKEICNAHIKFPVQVTSEATLSDQQVMFRYADGSAQLDLSKCVTEIQNAISAFYDALSESEANYG